MTLTRKLEDWNGDHNLYVAAAKTAELLRAVIMNCGDEAYQDHLAMHASIALAPYVGRFAEKELHDLIIERIFMHDSMRHFAAIKTPGAWTYLPHKDIVEAQERLTKTWQNLLTLAEMEHVCNREGENE